ncbi:MAG: FtsX-like permease family protein [Bacteroidales bacterium]|nr:FtsX-like permease family protein [Bacteroidales bacterium]
MILKLLIKEILHRKLNSVLSLLAIITAVTLFVSFFTMSDASKRETIRLTRDMGFNLRIIPKETDMNQFWLTGYSDLTMPEEYVDKFFLYKNFSYAHLTATLHKRVTWRNREVILTGISPEIEPSGIEKTSMIFSIEQGTVYIGFEIANSFGITIGDELEIFNKSFTVAKILSETGSSDDIRIYTTLNDVQEMVDKRGEINEIKALNCLCLTSDEVNPIEILRTQLNEVVPDAKVIINQTIAVAREKQRMMVEKYIVFILTFVVIVCAVWIAALAIINTRERQRETGILRAVGYRTGKIAALFLGKAVLLGLVGGVFGFLIGTGLASLIGPEIFKITANTIKPVYSLLIWSVIVAPAFTALSTLIPASLAITRDPALILMEE